MNNLFGTLTDKLETWIESAVAMLPNLVVAILILLIFYALAKLVKNASRKLLDKVTDNQTIIGLSETILGVSTLAIGTFIALSVLQLNDAVTSLLAGAGIIGLALGFAFQDIAANFISGILLSVRHPFGIGDIIETNGYFGTVIKLNLRNTMIRTFQGQVIYVPNKVVYENPFTNYTRNGERRIDLSCGVSYGDDLEKVKNVAVKSLSELGIRDKSRDVELFFNEFGDSSINFTVRFWVDFRKQTDFLSAQSDAIIKLKSAFDENDIMIPFPIRTLDFGIRGGEKLDTMISNRNNGNN
ncbi:mechanosensitive ion channel family protein [Balneola sp. MJW-20]|uniref:mechanosensitive ion channel family protein n=1 Tax=Gracilimonas aurantiaca TaxID=3234185 RepID=UPI0034672744